jgi:hypothetical protein
MNGVFKVGSQSFVQRLEPFAAGEFSTPRPQLGPVVTPNNMILILYPVDIEPKNSSLSLEELE